MLIFSYGSNMSSARLRARVPSAIALGVGSLAGYVLRFHKRSTDGSAKANAFRTDDPSDVLFGVVFEVKEEQKRDLDRHEGAGYTEQIVTVQIARQAKQVRMYVADAAKLTDKLKPYTWYVRYVLVGAREHNLPNEYVANIVNVPAVDDPDKKRHAQNWIDLPDISTRNPS